MKVFLDSDVTISSLLSKTGAAYFLVNKSKITKNISDVSKKEIESILSRKSMQKNSFELILENFEISKLQKRHLAKFTNYVFDANDSHIVAGAVKGKSKFLLTYNIKHYNTERIKRELNIIVMTPGLFLQYLRSRN